MKIEDQLASALEGLEAQNNTKKESPVFVEFVARDPDTNDEGKLIVLNKPEIPKFDKYSSNLSIFATSSLPFFDDLTPRNRDYSSIETSNLIVEVD